jgi:putative NADH-flavin reductase
VHIAIFGASGRTGQILTLQALAAGHTVTALVRRPEVFPLRDPHLIVHQGDAFDAATVESVLAGADAVLSVLGVPFGRKPITLYSEGIANIIRGAHRQGVRRLICVSSTAVDHRYHNGGGVVFERLLKPLIAGTIGRTTYDDQRRMEALVRASDLDWTIVRPSGLFEVDEVSDFEMTDGYTTGKFTSRTDLAACMLRLLGDQHHTRRTVAVATTAVQPALLRMILKEAFPRRDQRLASPR